MSSRSTAARPRSIPRISIATVYRTVRLFEEANILARHDFGDGRARYEEMPSDASRPSDRPANRPSDRVPQRGDRKTAASRRRTSWATSWSATASNCTRCRVAASVTVENDRMHGDRLCPTTAPAAASRDRRNRRPSRQRRRSIRWRSTAAPRRGRARSSISSAVRCRCGWPRRPPISMPRRRCATASSTRRWARGRCRKWRSRSRDIDLFDENLRPPAGARPRPRRRRGSGGRHLPPDPARAPRRAAAGSIRPAEYDIARLIAYPGEILELGRSCVDPAYRARGRSCSCCGAASPPMSSITTSR